MSVESSASQHKETTERDYSDKMVAAQNIIKEKFSKAFANRIINENNLNHVKQPLLMRISDDVSSLPVASSLNVPETSIIKPNDICNRLRIVVSKMIAGEVQHEGEMKNIIMRLRELEIIV